MKNTDFKLQKVACMENLCGIDICYMEDHTRFGNYILRVTTQIIEQAQSSETIDWQVTYPSSWWQHFKRDVMPKWFVKKFPVQLKTERKQYVMDLQLVKIADYEMLKSLGPNPVYVRVRQRNPASSILTEASGTC